MPWSWSYDSERDAFLIVGSGVVTEDELVSGMASRVAEFLKHPTARVLHDYSGITGLGDFSAKFYLQTSEDGASRLPLRRALLFSAQPADPSDLNCPSGLAASLIGYILGPNMLGELGIFTQRAAALHWLNKGFPPEQWAS